MISKLRDIWYLPSLLASDYWGYLVSANSLFTYQKYFLKINGFFKVKTYYRKHINTYEGERMEFPKGTKFKDGIDPDTGEKIKIAILPDGSEIKFWTDEDLEEI